LASKMTMRKSKYGSVNSATTLTRSASRTRRSHSRKLSITSLRLPHRLRIKKLWAKKIFLLFSSWINPVQCAYLNLFKANISSKVTKPKR